MAKAAKKSKSGSPGRKGKKAAAPGKSKKRGNKKNGLTWLAKGLLAATLVWFVIGGYIATNDLLQRRANCIDWLVQENRAIQGYKRVFNTDAARFGCSVQKLGLRGFIADPPIYPNITGLAIVFGPPLGLMAFYLLAWRFRRGLILHQKKKIWAKAGPIDFDDFEDMRDLPDEDDIAAQDAEDAAARMDAAESMNAALEDTASATPAAKPKPAAKSATKAKAAPPKAQDKSDKAAKPAKQEKPEKPEEELSELEKILRQVDD